MEPPALNRMFEKLDLYLADAREQWIAAKPQHKQPRMDIINDLLEERLVLMTIRDSNTTTHR